MATGALWLLGLDVGAACLDSSTGGGGSAPTRCACCASACCASACGTRPLGGASRGAGAARVAATAEGVHRPGAIHFCTSCMLVVPQHSLSMRPNRAVTSYCSRPGCSEPTTLSNCSHEMRPRALRLSAAAAEMAALPVPPYRSARSKVLRSHSTCAACERHRCVICSRTASSSSRTSPAPPVCASAARYSSCSSRFHVDGRGVLPLAPRRAVAVPLPPPPPSIACAGHARCCALRNGANLLPLTARGRDVIFWKALSTSSPASRGVALSSLLIAPMSCVSPAMRCKCALRRADDLSCAFENKLCVGVKWSTGARRTPLGRRDILGKGNVNFPCAACAESAIMFPEDARC